MACRVAGLRQASHHFVLQFLWDGCVHILKAPALPEVADMESSLTSPAIAADNNVRRVDRRSAASGRSGDALSAHAGHRD